MQECVDKQVEDELSLAHLVYGRLLGCFGEADEDLAVLLPERIGEDVRDVVFLAELLVQLARFGGPYEHERHLPAGEDGFGDL